MKIAHLYPREMNLYGDTGNVLVLRRRLEWRGLPAEVVPVRQGDAIPDDVDVLVGGGGQDAAQGDIGTDFVARGPQLRELAEAGVVVLAICGSYQLLGHRFVTHEGRDIPGVGILDVETFGSSTRLIGNIAVDSPEFGRLIGYENHSGLTRLGAAATPLGRTAAGRGNNGEDRGEGAVWRNVVGTYLHGPLLAKAPRLADELLRRALVRRGELGAGDTLPALDDRRADRAAEVAVTRPR